MNGLNAAQIEQFIRDGFVRIDRAFSREDAAAVRALLWRDAGCDPHDTATWSRPVVRLGHYSQAPFLRAANTPILLHAFDQLAGAGKWLPCNAMGTFPIRFPSAADPGDTGWHIDAGFDWHLPDFLSWRSNIHSRGRLLLMLFLFSDVGEDDAPTRLRTGSHRDIARMLAPSGEQGLTLRELAANGFDESARRQEAIATGEAGTVYLCHPFLVHAGQRHRGSVVRFIAQPPLLPRSLDLRAEAGEGSPVRVAIDQALGSRSVPGR